MHRLGWIQRSRNLIGAGGITLAATLATQGCGGTKGSPAPGATGTGGGGTAASSGNGGGTSSGGATGGADAGGATSSKCPLPSYPDASCTGYPPGAALTVVTGDQYGDIKMTTEGAVYDGEDFQGCLVVEANNVTIKNSKITCNGGYAIRQYPNNTGMLVEDTEIDCQNSTATGVVNENFTALRLDIHGCVNGFGIGNNVTIKDSYVHDFPVLTPNPHTDAIQIDENTFNITITHNSLLNNDLTGSSAIISNMVTNTTINDNLLAGGGYALYCPKATTPSYHVLDNHFGRMFTTKGGFYGPWVYCNNVDAQGNVWDDTKMPVAF
jgi:hypothetical protein